MVDLVWNPQSELLREPNLLIPGKKPVGRVKIDWSHPLAKGLIGCWLFNDGQTFFKDLTGNNDGHFAGTGSGIDIGPDANGLSARVIDDNTADRINLGSITSDNPLRLQGGVVSIHVTLVHTVSANNAFPRIIDKSNSGSASGGWAFYTEDNDQITFSVNGSNYAFSGYSPTGEIGSIGLSSRSTTQDAYQDGKRFNGGSGVYSMPTTTTNAALLNWNHTTDRQYESPVYCIYVWARYLSDVEHAELDADPYQFLIPA